MARPAHGVDCYRTLQGQPTQRRRCFPCGPRGVVLCVTATGSEKVVAVECCRVLVPPGWNLVAEFVVVPYLQHCSARPVLGIGTGADGFRIADRASWASVPRTKGSGQLAEMVVVVVPAVSAAERVCEVQNIVGSAHCDELCVDEPVVGCHHFVAVAARGKNWAHLVIGADLLDVTAVLCWANVVHERGRKSQMRAYLFKY